jgi:hypothetical protein
VAETLLRSARPDLAGMAIRHETLRGRCDDMVRLQHEMRVLRSRTRIRRDQLREERARLREDMQMRRSVLQTKAARAAAAVLDAASHVSGMEGDELWLQYFALGGEASPDELEQILSGALPLRRLDHDRLAVAINERFQEQGAGRLLAYWDGSR